MALTQILRTFAKTLEPVERSLRDRVRWAHCGPIAVPAPQSYRGEDWAVVGRAFDFWVRAYLCVRHGACEARTILDELLSALSGGAVSFEAEILTEDGARLPFADYVALIIESRKHFIASRNVSSASFYQNCLDHAQLEGLCRSGDFIAAVPAEGIADLRRLTLLAAERGAVFAGQTYVLNPQFPAFARWFGGADADFAVDKTLVEVKTTNERLPRGVLTQALAYAILDSWEQGRVGGAPRWTNIAVYCARYGDYAVVGLDEVSREREFLEHLLLDIGTAAAS